MKTISTLKLIAIFILLFILLFAVTSCYSSATDKEIAFIDKNGSISIVDSSGKYIRQLPNSHKAKSLAWSSDGNKIGYQSWDGNESSLWILTVEDGTEVLAFKEEGPGCSGSWSPDGKFLAVDVGSVSGSLFILSGSTYEVKNQVPHSLRYVWSPDGRFIATSIKLPVDPPLDIQEGTSYSLAVIDPETGSTRVILEGSADYYLMAISWDKDGIVFLKQPVDPVKSAGEGLYGRVNLQGEVSDLNIFRDFEALKLLPEDLRSTAGQFSWSNDGTEAVVEVNDTNKHQIYLISLPDKTAVPLVEGTSPVWRPR